jgi:hypothetical protein
VLPERRRLLLIGVLALLAAIAGWTYFGGGSAPATAPAAGGNTAGRRQNPAAKGAETLPEAEAVRLSSLSQSRDEPSSATRNPFKFRREATGGKDTPDAPVFKPVEPSDVTAPAGPAPPPPIPLKFIGVLEKTDGGRWAVLSVGEGRAPLHGKEGDIIDGRYRILKIGNESIDLAYLDGRGRQTIRLTGQ